jgi:hypothetical protein
MPFIKLKKKKHQMYPYKPDLVQHLCLGNYERKITFVSWLVSKLEDNLIILNFILWTDESKFTNNGIINKQNYFCWYY